ncbi:MAG: hypothetical protein ACJATK_001507, partial [Paracoccaceae bacterium]
MPYQADFYIFNATVTQRLRLDVVAMTLNAQQLCGFNSLAALPWHTKPVIVLALMLSIDINAAEQPTSNNSKWSVNTNRQADTAEEEKTSLESVTVKP